MFIKKDHKIESIKDRAKPVLKKNGLYYLPHLVRVVIERPLIAKEILTVHF